MWHYDMYYLSSQYLRVIYCCSCPLIFRFSSRVGNVFQGGPVELTNFSLLSVTTLGILLITRTYRRTDNVEQIDLTDTPPGRSDIIGLVAENLESLLTKMGSNLRRKICEGTETRLSAGRLDFCDHNLGVRHENHEELYTVPHLSGQEYLLYIRLSPC